MFRYLYTAEPGLAASVRLPALGHTDQPIQKLEVVFLMGMGVAAAAAAHFIDFGLRIPGHAIIRVIFPIAMGIALVPRRGAGGTMGLVAAISTVAFTGTRMSSAGFGAVTSLLLSGIVLDFVTVRARSGWPLYAGLALAGLTINMVAFAAKAGSKLMGLGGGGGGGWHSWLPRAAISYPLCGLVAGLVCAVILFRLRRGDDRS